MKPKYELQFSNFESLVKWEISSFSVATEHRVCSELPTSYMLSVSNESVQFIYKLKEFDELYRMVSEKQIIQNKQIKSKEQISCKSTHKNLLTYT